MTMAKWCWVAIVRASKKVGIIGMLEKAKSRVRSGEWSKVTAPKLQFLASVQVQVSKQCNPTYVCRITLYLRYVMRGVND